MKDIDFDELDKAVNSLMATTPVDQPAIAPVTDSSPAQAVVSVPAAAPEPMPAVITSAPETPVAVRSAPPAIRRSGRFMDMVPSSTDKKARSITTPQQSNTREGLAISPRVESAPPVAVESARPEPASPSQPVTMPDPIDVAQDELSQSEQMPTLTVEPAVDTTAEPTALAPLESPFITDAKVEKRPLNAGGNDRSAPVFDMQGILDADELKTDEVDSSDSSTKDHADEPPITPQIPELSSDLVAIESSDSADVNQVVDTTNATGQVTAPVPPLGAASIAQQYQTQASTGDQSHAAIYDAAQYPEPVTHPANHKSGWLWVLWVVLLLGIGAGGAFLLYNFGIIP